MAFGCSGHDGTKTNGIFPVFFILSVVCILCCCFAQCLGSLLLYGGSHCVGQYMPFATQWLLHRVAGYYGQAGGWCGQQATTLGSLLLQWVHCKLLRFTATFGWYGRAGGERMRILYSASVDALQGSEAHPLSRPSFKHFAGYTGCFCFGIYLLFCFV